MVAVEIKGDYVDLQRYGQCGTKITLRFWYWDGENKGALKELRVENNLG